MRLKTFGTIWSVPFFVSSSMLVAQAPAAVAATQITSARVFSEPLMPMGAEPSAAENQALWEAVQAYQKVARSEDVSAFEAFLDAHPGSPWEASLRTQLGLTYRRTGYYSKAMHSWQRAWSLAGMSNATQAGPIGDLALANLAELYARLGRVTELEKLLTESKGRPMRGGASEKWISAGESLQIMKVTPERNFRCGPLSLASIRAAAGKPEPKLLAENSSPQGTSLAHNAQLASKYGMDLQMAKRTPGAKVIVPAVMHWKTGHFAAVVQESNGRYLLQDPTFPEDIWVSQAALDDEATGYALVSKGALPKGWQSVTEAEGLKVWGKGGAPFGNDKYNRKNGVKRGTTCPTNQGMAGHSFHLLTANLTISDIPVGYAPALGPSALFEVTYNQRESQLPQTFTFSNLGPKWTFDFLSYIEDDPTIAIDTSSFSMRVNTFERGGGGRTFVFSNTHGADVATQTATGPSLPQADDQSQLIRTNLTSYVRVYPNGSQEVYAQPDGSRTFPRRIFLTKIVDAKGATLTINYDSQLRVTSLVDAQGKTTTLSYELTQDPLKVTKVTDPFGRFATFEYNTAGQLVKITDVVGIQSQFTYGPTSDAPSLPVDFVNALTTPYGTHRYTTGGDMDGRWVEALDPLGNRSRVEFKRHPFTAVDSEGNLPFGFISQKVGGSFYWDKRNMAQHPGDYRYAEYTRWVMGTDGEGSIDLPHSIKPAGESTFTTWFAYPGQYSTSYEGSVDRPSRVIRRTGDGRFVETRFEYNALGRPTKSIDPLGRETSFVYAANLIDLLEVRQTSHGRNDLLARYTYDDKHLPLTVTDASGQTTSLQYNVAGQLTTVTNPLGQAVTLTYNPLGQLTSVLAPGNRSTSLHYDVVGRVDSVTDAENQTVAMTYDALDRPTRVDFPDGTYEELHYDRLEATLRRDRSGKWTSMTYNALRQLVEVLDPSGRSTKFEWCGCGSLESLIDPMGKATHWLYDLDGRLVSKELPDGTRSSFAYDLFGRLIQRIDAKGQITSYAYNIDDTLQSVSYSNTSRTEPSVSYTYDQDYRRISKVSRNGQDISYTYAPIVSPAVLGAGRLFSVTGPLPTDVISYGYDALGRTTHREVKGRASDVAFDGQGRVQQVTNPLGAFTYQYDGTSGRLTTVNLPNGMKTTFAYFGADQEFRLKSIQNQTGQGANISSFAYTYDLDGQIKTWTQTPGVEDPKTYTFTYDAVGQLLNGTLTGVQGQTLRQFVYGYDLSGNRTSETVDGNTTTATYNDGNQLTSTRTSDNAAALMGKKVAPKAASKPKKQAPAASSRKTL
jgi:YD repeat-containing protein